MDMASQDIAARSQRKLRFGSPQAPDPALAGMACLGIAPGNQRKRLWLFALRLKAYRLVPRG